MKSVYSAVRTGSLNKAVCGSSLNFKTWSRFAIYDFYVTHTEKGKGKGYPRTGNEGPEGE